MNNKDSSIKRTLILALLPVIIASVVAVLVYFYPTWHWFLILIFAGIIIAWQVLKQRKKEETKEHREKARNAANIIRTRMDDFKSNLVNGKQSVFYGGAPYMDHQRPKLLVEYRDCRYAFLEHAVNDLYSRFEEAEKSFDIDKLIACFGTLGSKAIFYNARVNEFYNILKEVECSNKTKKWFDDVVKENSDFIKNLKKDRSALSNIAAKPVAEISIRIEDMKL